MDPVSLCNLALGQLGVTPVTAIDGSDPSEAGQRLESVFPHCRDVLLEQRNWTFATQRYQLPADVVPPVYGYTTRFLLPPEVLRVISVEPSAPAGTLDAFAVELALEDGVDVTHMDWDVEGRYVLAGAVGSAQAGQPIPSLNLKALVNNLPAQWTPSFNEALQARIASELCIPLTQKTELKDKLWALYETKIKEAASADGRQGKNKRRTSNTLARRRL